MFRVALAERPDPDGRMHRCDAEDGFVASLRTVTGVTAVIDCSLETPVSTPERMVVIGSTGMLELDDEGIVRRSSAGDVETHAVDLQGKSSLVLSMERWAAFCCDAVRGGTALPGWPTFADGLACAVVMDRMGRSGARSATR